MACGPWLRAGSIPDAARAAGSGYDFVPYDLEHDASDLEGLRAARAAAGR